MTLSSNANRRNLATSLGFAAAGVATGVLGAYRVLPAGVAIGMIVLIHLAFTFVMARRHRDAVAAAQTPAGEN